MPRQARSLALISDVYHIIDRGNHQDDVFFDDEDYQSFLNIISLAEDEFCFNLFYYVLMSNHYHLVMQPREPAHISEIMKRINQQYTIYSNRRYDKKGHLWQDRPKTIAINDDAQLLACGIYVELDPVRASIVAEPQDYPWSSYQFHTTGRHNRLLRQDPMYLGLSNSLPGCRKSYTNLADMWATRHPTKKEERSGIID